MSSRWMRKAEANEPDAHPSIQAAYWGRLAREQMEKSIRHLTIAMWLMGISATLGVVALLLPLISR